MILPAKIVAGDTLTQRVCLQAYPASDGWTLHVRLAARTHGNLEVTLDAAASGAEHVLSAAATATAAWVPDAYTAIAWVTRASDVVTVDPGSQVVVQPNPRTMTAGYDGRSLARRTLDDLVAAKAAWDVSRGMQRRYKIADRELEFNTEAEIIQKIAFWERELLKEAADARLAAGMKRRNVISTRFVRPS